MSSINAENVAKEVIKTVRKGRKVKLGEIIKETGYSVSVSESPTKVTKTKSYKKVMEPVIMQMERIRRLAMRELENKDLSKVQYSDLSNAITKMTHDIQLLSGGSTENVAVQGVEISIRK